MTPSQLSLLNDPNPSPMVRHTDPTTSRLAAGSVDISKGQAAVLAALTNLCDIKGSATDREIEGHFACRFLGRGSAIKRRLELERLGLVERCGYDFSGRTPMLTFRVTEQGREAAK